ncbi:alpha/beta fold hydrolase [Parvularcula marina]|uniref:alpha/beta fold hydrolase n=1 Tax=Parvularcula marina TaxID=2292771 RepID=UPI003517361D
MRLVNVLGVLIVLAAGAGGLWYWQSRDASPVEETETVSAEPVSSEPVERFVDVAGATIRIREEGPADAPVLLLLHGFTYSLETWDGWAEELSDRYRIIRYDLLGHGLTGPDPQERYAPKERAQFVGEVMDALELDHAIIGGNSLGGLAAWRFASMSPERVDAMILVSPGAYPMNGVGDEAAPVPPALSIYLQTVPDIALRASIARIYADPASVPEERIQEIGAMMRREGNGEAMIKSLEEFTLPDPDEDLRKLTMPVLLLWGEADQVIPPEHAERLMAVLPDAMLITYPGVGHVTHEEETAKSAADVAAFLSDHGLEK